MSTYSYIDNLFNSASQLQRPDYVVSAPATLVASEILLPPISGQPQLFVVYASFFLRYTLDAEFVPVSLPTRPPTKVDIELPGFLGPFEGVAKLINTSTYPLTDNPFNPNGETIGLKLFPAIYESGAPVVQLIFPNANNLAVNLSILGIAANVLYGTGPSASGTKAGALYSIAIGTPTASPQFE